MTVLPRTLDAFEFLWATPLIFGKGKISELSRIVKNSGYKTALIITDKGLIKAGIVEKVTGILENAKVSCDVFDKVEPNPVETIVDQGAKIARETSPDVIIGLGGGSSIDTAKCAAILATNPGRIRDYSLDVVGVIGLKAKAHGIPVIAIPTTSGTGTECNVWAIITHTEKWEKLGVGGPSPYPNAPNIAAKIAIDDPELTLTLPPNQTAATGLDALSHLMEGYTSLLANPISDALQEYGIKLVAENLPIAYANGRDINARAAMMLASCIGCAVMSTGDAGGMHCIGEALGGLYGNPPRPVIAHGVTCVLSMPWIVEYNCMSNPVKFARMAELLGEDVSHLSLNVAALKCVDAVKRLINMLDMPHSLKELGVDKNDLPKIAEIATRNMSIDSNPRVLPYEVILDILEKEYEGW